MAHINDFLPPNNNKTKKLLFLLLDGVGDTDCPELSMKTPLECADIPVLNTLAQEGHVTLMDSVAPGLACGTDTAHLNLFGFPPEQFFSGRGVYEALGVGIDVQPGDIAFKSNFAIFDSFPSSGEVESVSKYVTRVPDRRADRNFEDDGPLFCNYLNGMHLPAPFEDVSIHVTYACEHRCGLLLRSSKGPLDPRVTGNDPLTNGLNLMRSVPLVDEPAAIRTAQVINCATEFLSKTIYSHPRNVERAKENRPVVNGMLLRAPSSQSSDQISFEEMNGFQMDVVTGTAIIKGIARSLKMKLHDNVPGANGDLHSNFKLKSSFAVERLIESTESKAVFLHIKGTDDAGHMCDPKLKKEQIEKVDNGLKESLPRLQQHCSENDEELVIIVTADHSTPCAHGDHGPQPVPILIWNSSNLSTRPSPLFDQWSERTSMRSGIKSCTGSEVIEFMRRVFRH